MCASWCLISSYSSSLRTPGPGRAWVLTFLFGVAQRLPPLCCVLSAGSIDFTWGGRGPRPPQLFFVLSGLLAHTTSYLADSIAPSQIAFNYMDQFSWAVDLDMHAASQPSGVGMKVMASIVMYHFVSLVFVLDFFWLPWGDHALLASSFRPHSLFVCVESRIDQLLECYCSCRSLDKAKKNVYPY